jgi:NAD(P)-dependent dehydrogenase (short-subunit alcohol dehydrogenase family)
VTSSDRAVGGDVNNEADASLIALGVCGDRSLSWRSLVNASLETGRRRSSPDEQGSVIVVGGAGSIGSAVVATYLERAISVAVVDQNTLPAGTPPSPEARLHQVVADVTQADEIARASLDLAQLEWRFTHLVSLAGGALPVEFESLTDIDASTIERSVELNLTSHILLTRAFLLLLRADSSQPAAEHADRSITLVSSINALRDYGLPAYSAAKAGMFGFVCAMAAELGREGIRINAVVPGTVVTPSSQTQPKDFEALRRGSALGRLARPEDIAAAVYAVSHTLTAVTGQHLVVDCGQLVKAPDWRSSGDDNGEEAGR